MVPGTLARVIGGQSPGGVLDAHKIGEGFELVEPWQQVSGVACSAPSWGGAQFSGSWCEAGTVIYCCLTSCHSVWRSWTTTSRRSSTGRRPRAIEHSLDSHRSILTDPTHGRSSLQPQWYDFSMPKGDQVSGSMKLFLQSAGGLVPATGGFHCVHQDVVLSVVGMRL